jgi:alkanesulfonate monooxygenase SsuD/methylene tetrahydromethanopterin reductase-like flavin-dependent oxidoreductase (luciferase family)
VERRGRRSRRCPTPRGPSLDAPRSGGAIPIWLGGFRPVAIERAARLGDGFIISPTRPATRPATRASLARQGRDPSSFPIELGCHWSVGIDELAAQLELAESAAVGSVSINTMTVTAAWRGQSDAVQLESVDDHIQALERFIRFAQQRVAPHVPINLTSFDIASPE